MTDNSRQFRLVVNKKAVKRQISGGLYLITDSGDSLLDRVAAALRGGVATLQYRPKGVERNYSLAEGQELKKLCRKFGVTFIVNDDVSLAAELDADGVHLGQDDGSIADARGILGNTKIIGISTHSIEEAKRAEEDGADYIGFGSIYPTETKQVTHIAGTAGLKGVCQAVDLPVVAIGGISISNACRVIDAGADCIAVISSVLSSPRPDIAAMELKLLFNRTSTFPCGSVMTVAGSDSGGGAGIQADIKTVTLLGSYAASSITALTAQNTTGVSSVYGLPPSFVIDQLKTVLSDLPIDVIKTGMLHTPAIVSAIADFFADSLISIPLVVDPVMVAKGGSPLLEKDAVAVFCDQLLPLAYLLTPNIPEAERLIGRQIRDEADMEKAAMELHQMGAANVLLKGGHLVGQDACDILFDGKEIHRFTAQRIFTSNTHGTGCSYASAIAALLAQGEPLLQAVEHAKNFITSAIRNARSMGHGHGPINHYIAAEENRKG